MAKRVLFLYTELAEYFLACVGRLQQDGVDVHIVRWPVNKEAPFSFDFPEGIKIYEKEHYDQAGLSQLIHNIQPDAIYVSGWVDKQYLAACKGWKSKIPVIVGLDNQWTGEFRQRVATWLSPFMIHRYFNRAWVPGNSQRQFAIKLGFDDQDILTGFYSCDFDRFNALYKKALPEKSKSMPKRFIYVGRYYDFKGVEEMWTGFVELQEAQANNWELWSLGTGDIKGLVHPKIKHFGFVQPDEMAQHLAQTSVFILPSRFEPWGVVIHEFASAGFPIICTREVGSAQTFVKQSENGYIINANDKKQLKTAMRTMMSMSDKELLEMGERSVELASQITPDKWVKTLVSTIS